MLELINATMNSKELAELTGKSHSHLCRDIRTQLDTQNINQSKLM